MSSPKPALLMGSVDLAAWATGRAFNVQAG